MEERKVWFLQLNNQLGQVGIGEVAPIARLSPESLEDIPIALAKLAERLKTIAIPSSIREVYDLVKSTVPENFPSIRFGLEVALLDLLHGGQRQIFEKNPASLEIPINGLVWMGDADFMRRQITAKLDEGFECIKLKVGALDFETELEIIRELRSISEELVIRLDANGGFHTQEVFEKLRRLSAFDIHSIEQPIMPRQPEAMALVCERSQIPIALDEELIGVESSQDKLSLLQDIKPHYVVLKPTLHGGIASVSEWIDLAKMHGIGWWLTSYLESNIGLNAIAQLAACYKENAIYHGLGTGGLYHNNITSPILIQEGMFKYAASNVWDIDFLGS